MTAIFENMPSNLEFYHHICKTTITFVKLPVTFWKLPSYFENCSHFSNLAVKSALLKLMARHTYGSMSALIMVRWIIRIVYFGIQNTYICNNTNFKLWIISWEPVLRHSAAGIRLPKLKWLYISIASIWNFKR